MKDKETLFREKATTYLCCYNNHCPRHAQCLRWEVGTFTDPNQHITTCISPHYAKSLDGSCEHFRDNRPQRMPVGMKNFYHDMPSSVERAIKNTLISHSCRATYYKYHRGDRPITPKVLADIQSVCQQFGWTQPPKFDTETEDYLW